MNPQTPSIRNHLTEAILKYIRAIHSPEKESALMPEIKYNLWIDKGITGYNLYFSGSVSFEMVKNKNMVVRPSGREE